MGMYTELVFGCSLKKDAPDEVVNILRYLSDNNDAYESFLPQHPFFNCNRWRLIGSNSSCYFGGASHFQFIVDSIMGYRISLRCNIKNCDNEIQKFIDWIMPYVNYGAGYNELLGYYIYEKDIEPTLIYRVKVENGG